jgi:Sulfate permease family
MTHRDEDRTNVNANTPNVDDENIVVDDGRNSAQALSYTGSGDGVVAQPNDEMEATIIANFYVEPGAEQSLSAAGCGGDGGKNSEINNRGKPTDGKEDEEKKPKRLGQKLSSSGKSNESSVEQKEEAVEPSSSQRRRDPFWAFIPQIGQWVCNVATQEAQIVANSVVGAPSFTKNFLSDTVVFYKKNPKVFYNEIISGFTVAIMQVPESIAFSFVAGVPPLGGLQATWWMAFITGIFGGKPGMISGAAGALAVVVTHLTSSDGVLLYLPVDERLNVLYMTMFVCGLFQIGFSILRLAKLVRLIPETGMIGFMNGLAIIIFMAQLPAFQYCDAADVFIDCTVDERKWLTFQGQPLELCLVLIHVFMCMVIMKYWPKAPYVGKWIPASLMGLLVGTLIEWTLFRRVIGQGTRTVEETAPVAGEPPKFDWPAIPSDDQTIRIMFVYGIQLAAIGAVESVLTLQAPIQSRRSPILIKNASPKDWQMQCVECSGRWVEMR